ncbi:MAG TPA: glycosyltransferase [Mucilaginibacter sp.]|nr:glycosyltransferase [Mucilaginibacter sp.]
MSDILNLFYEEPDPDRWIKYDRYPRKVIRRLVRGKQRPGGVMLVALNLMKGLDKIGVPYRFNDYQYIKRHPEEIACIIGKPQVLFDRNWQNPIIFGAGIYSHPIECPDLFERYPNVKRFLVPGEWMRDMCEPYYGDKVTAWPVGIDTEQWKPLEGEKTFEFLIYYKIRWQHDQMEKDLVEPITKTLDAQNISYQFIRYGNYTHDELTEKLRISKAVIFLCEHETQGSAYQQILATNTPILAWDRGGYWQDPAYYPRRVKYQPVSSVPYWDERCGLKFIDAEDFKEKLNDFFNNLNTYNPRNYILENLTLEKCAENYLEIYRQVEGEIE